VVIAEINPQTLGEAVKELESKGLSCLGVQTDVMQRPSIEAAVEATVSKFGRVDGLVNNAFARSGNAGVADITDEQLDINYRSMVKGTLWGMQTVYPHMKTAGWGRIVNVGSSAGLVGFKGMGAYGAAKEAIRSLTRTAAREWAVDGIVVNCYCPVSMGHHMHELDAAGSFQDQSMQILAALMPTGSFGTNGDPENDLGPAVAFLLSDDCRYLTGQTVTLDGGAYTFA
jgi:NAD(P)-dependent dehydrogenase (short-subunit alcohol dehydrogenase family)